MKVYCPKCGEKYPYTLLDKYQVAYCTGKRVGNIGHQPQQMKPKKENK